MTQRVKKPVSLNVLKRQGRLSTWNRGLLTADCEVLFCDFDRAKFLQVTFCRLKVPGYKHQKMCSVLKLAWKLLGQGVLCSA